MRPRPGLDCSATDHHHYCHLLTGEGWGGGGHFSSYENENSALSPVAGVRIVGPVEVQISAPRPAEGKNSMNKTHVRMKTEGTSGGCVAADHKYITCSRQENECRNRKTIKVVLLQSAQ